MSHIDLLYGNKALGIYGTSKRYKPQDMLTWENGCLFAEAGSAIRMDCEKFERGLMKNGLHAALEEYVFTIKNLQDSVLQIQKEMQDHGRVEMVVDSAAQQLESQKRHPNAISLINATDWTTLKRQLLHMPDFLMLYQMAQHPGYLHLSLMESVYLIEVEAMEAMENFIQLLHSTWIMFIVTLLLTYLFLMRKYLHKINSTIQEARAMLLVLPGEVLLSIDSTRKFIKMCEEEAVLIGRS